MGQPTRPEVAPEATPVEQEGVVLDAPPMTPADNTRVAELRASNTQSLTEAGVLPELSISGDFGVVYKNFDQIDQYKDGQISKWELNQYMKNSPDLTQ